MLATGTTDAVPNESLIGREFGRFRLLELIGAGGTGVVFRAERTDGVTQAVAIKLLGADVAGGGYARFAHEANLLGRLVHSAVARLIDTGVQDGRGWIALEFIRGQPIDAYCEAQRLSVRSRVKLLVQIADAVAAAHRMLIVHRDIKPANVLVNEAGMPKLIDFGIAASLNPLDGPRSPTVDMGRLFTPHYAAPEQVLGEPVTVATDVFGLGALAFRLLTGVVCHAGATGPVRYLLAVTEHEVDAASQAALAASGDFRDARALRGDLDAILHRALARAPAERYASADELSADLQRHLDNVPVHARPPSFHYRLNRFARRHRIPVVTGAVLALALAIGGVVYGLQARTIAHSRDMAVRRGEFLESMIKSVNRAERRDITVADLLDAASRQSKEDLVGEPLVAASLLGVVASTNAGLGRFPQALAANERQLALLRANRGPAADLIGTLIQRGDLLNTSGHTQDAEPPLREAMRLLKNRCGSDAQLAEAANVLGVVLTNSAREREAESQYDQSIACYRHAGGRTASKAADPLNNLQVLLGNEGRYEESLRAGREAVALMQTRVGADHPDLLGMQMNLAGTLANLHQDVEAEAILRDVIEKRARILGADHLDTLNARTQLADDLYEQHRDAEAAAFELPTAQTLDRVAGVDHPWTLYAWALYGITACRSQQGDAGLEALRRVAAARVRLYGADDWHTHSTRVSIGICLVVLHRYAEAEPGLLQSAARLEADRGSGFLRTQAAYEALRDLYSGLGRREEAARWGAKLQAHPEVP
jgi:tetratricopeptide (TPR) repeat protein